MGDRKPATKKRDRAKNFLEDEKQRLITIVEKYKSIVENKQTDAVNAEQKAKAWNDIAIEYNSSAKTGERTGVQLKLSFEGLKKLAKKHKADEKAEIYKTGGGPAAVTQITPTDERMISLLGAQICAHENVYDSNADFNFDDAIVIDAIDELNFPIGGTVLFEQPDDQPQKQPETLQNLEVTEVATGASSSYPNGQKDLPMKKVNTIKPNLFVQNSKKKRSIASGKGSNAKELFEMKMERHNKKLEILEIIKRKESAELEIKEIELQLLKRQLLTKNAGYICSVIVGFYSMIKYKEYVTSPVGKNCIDYCSSYCPIVISIYSTSNSGMI